MMTKRIPIKSAKQVAKDHNLKQVILFGWDGEKTHVVTYGETIEDCDMAAQGGNEMKENWGWSEDYMSEPSRVTKLKKEIKILKERIKVLENEQA